MFTQLDRSLARTRTGLGVGLAVARQLVQMHEGRLELHSHGAGCGSVFSVLLPRLADAPAEPPPLASGRPPPPRATPARPLRVLVADDNVDFADGLASALRHDGHQVRVAHDGLAALELARAELPEVGLFDIGMPGLDGYELARALRREPGGAATRLVAITGWGQQADQQQARAAGFDEHLVKPVDMDTLLALLARVA